LSALHTEDKFNNRLNETGKTSLGGLLL